MKRQLTPKTEADYAPLASKELEYYGWMAADLGIGMDTLRQAADLGVRDGIRRHRASKDCKNRESECVTWSVRHFVDRVIVKACLLASSEEEMEKAEEVLLRLVED